MTVRYVYAATSQDCTIAVWDIKTPKDIVLKRVLADHKAAVNAVDFDDKYIVSASGDRTIKVGLYACTFRCMYIVFSS